VLTQLLCLLFLCAQYQSWLTSEEDALRVLNSFSNVIGRLDLLMAATADATLGPLARVQGVSDALIKCHLSELERLMKLLRQLYGQLNDQLGRLERLCDETCTLHRSTSIELPDDEHRQGSTVQSVDSYVSWTVDVTAALGHEMWRKAEMLDRLNYGSEGADRAMRDYIVTHWSSSSKHTLLNRALFDSQLDTSQQSV
jgi:Casein Kinase 2 substrate